MQVRWNKKLPKHYLHSVSQSVSSHQGGRSFARVTHLSVQPSKSKIRRSFQRHFSIPSLGQSRCHLAAAIKGKDCARHNHCRTTGAFGWPLAQRHHCPPCSFQSAQCKRISISWHLLYMQVQQQSGLFFSAGFDLSCLGARAPKIGKDVRKLEESVNLRCRRHNSWLRPWFERLPAVHWPNVG